MFEFAKKMLVLKQLNIEKGKIELLGQRVVIIPIKLITLLIDLYSNNKELEKKIYAIMRESVRDYSLVAKEKFKFKPENLLSMLMDLTRLNGYGDITLEKISYSEKKVLFKVEGLPSLYLKGSKNYGNFMADSYWAGILAGGISVIFDDNSVECIEIKCVLTNSPACLFMVAQKKFLEENYKDFYSQKF